MSSRRAKAHSVSGWTAFDLKQRRKQLAAADSNPYPSLSGLTAPQSLLNRNESLLDKPFSSVLAPSINFPSLKDIKNEKLPASPSSLGTTAVAVDTNGKLKDLHPWADESLIQDVLAGVNNNVLEASSLLEAMVITDHQVDKKLDTPDASLGFNHNKQPMDEESTLQLLDTIKSLPVEPEPEWGEDDVYLIYRKDAIRMTRYYVS